MRLSKKWFTAIAAGQDDNTIFLRVRTDIDEHRQSAKYPIRVDIHWHFDKSASGLPDEETAKAIDEWGSAVQRAMEKNCLAICVLQATGDNETLWSYYTRNIDAFQSCLNESTQDLPLAPLTFHAEKDELWEAYDEALSMEENALEKDA